jgi:hypothetical protein
LGATKKGQGSSPQTTGSEEAKCEGTRAIHRYVLHTGKVRYGSEQDMGLYATNDLPGCPNKGGVLLGTDNPDKLAGKDGDDEIRGLGAKDLLFGGDGNDVIYAGPGDDFILETRDRGHDKIYCGDGKERSTGSRLRCEQERLCGQQLRGDINASWGLLRRRWSVG